MIADEEVLAREGLTRLLIEAGLEVVGATGDADGLLRAIEADRPEVAIIDAGLSSVAEQIRSRFPDVAVLVLSADPVAAQAVTLLSQSGGGIGYLLKGRISNIEELTGAIRRVAEGQPVVDPQVVSGLVDEPTKPGALEALTEREQQVLALMAEGHSNQAIAERLFLGPKTVETHVGRIFTKLGLESAGDIHRRVLAVIAYLRST
jgi:DNA-binding NarL/FixJ family response regulator